MSADVKSLRSRIRSVDSTLHLTRAMGLVASSKMRRANQSMQHGRQYAAAMDEVIDVLRSSPECARTPYMRPAGEGTRLIVIAGDRGLAGGYNANVFKLAETVPDAGIIAIGKRACERYGQSVISSERFSGADAAKMAGELCRDFLDGKYGKLGILYTGYKNMMSQEAKIRWVLPLETAGKGADAAPVFEPDEETVLNGAVPSYVAGILFACIRESFACEVAARRMAMDSAGKNAQEMIDHLQLQYNRARQNNITQEITEIVAGSGL
ncbi:MAG: ATP synthase F1 subunit gamma [Clostridiales bacterium]|nr:ATP synthase F1 subunit gamma [Clostridiales bacterium]